MVPSSALRTPDRLSGAGMAKKFARIQRKPGPITAIHPKSLQSRRVDLSVATESHSRRLTALPICTERSVIPNPSGWIRAASMALRVMIG
jgi:hypothetical protein